MLKNIFRKLYPLLLSIEIVVVRLYRAGFGYNRRSVFICPTAPPGSFGDEAMLEGCLDHYRDIDGYEINLISLDDGEKWINVNGVSNNLSLTATKFFPIRYLQFLWAIRRCSGFCVLGADTIDGHYSREWSLQKINMAEIAAKAGLESSILGFSFNETADDVVIKRLNKLPLEVRLCGRDPVSYRRLVERVAHPSILVADLAFLLRPDGETEKTRLVESWVRSQRDHDRRVIGINANYENYKTFVNPATKDSVRELVACYVEAIRQVDAAEGNNSYLLLPHDTRDTACESGDVQLALAIYEQMPIEIQSRALVVPMPCRAAEIKYLAGLANVVLSGRMHLAIASLGMGTPAACITYQDKFEGLFQHFRIGDMTISPVEAFKNGGLGEFMIAVMERESELRCSIAEAFPEVRAMSQRNFPQEK